MHSHADDSLDGLIGRVIHLRTRALLDSKLQPFLEGLRLQLAGALYDLPEDGNHSRGVSFRVDSTWEGASVIRADGRSIPLDPGCVNHVLDERGLAVSPGEGVAIDAALARDLIEEALARVGCDQVRLQNLRRELVRFHLLADERAARCA